MACVRQHRPRPLPNWNHYKRTSSELVLRINDDAETHRKYLRRSQIHREVICVVVFVSRRTVLDGYFRRHSSNRYTSRIAQGDCRGRMCLVQASRTCPENPRRNTSCVDGCVCVYSLSPTRSHTVTRRSCTALPCEHSKSV